MPEPIELVADVGCVCGEAPTWDAGWGHLLFTDNESNIVRAFSPSARSCTTYAEGLMVCGIALNRDGRAVFSGFNGLYLWREADEHVTLLTEHDGQKLQLNDMVADPQGRLYVGTLYWGPNGMERTGQLLLIDTDLGVRVVDEGIQLSNGLSLSPDDRTLYYADSAARLIYAYAVEPATGELRHRRVFAKVPAEDGIPDGLTVDADGFVWSAMWYGSQIVRYDPNGRIERRIAMPAKQVSSVAFGGPDLTDLYVTSAAASWPSPLMPPGYDPHTGLMGGGLYRVRTGIIGKPEHRTNFR